MKRICSESEKQLIQENSSLLLKGIYRSTAQNRFRDVFITLGLYFVLLIAVCIPLVALVSRVPQTGFASLIIPFCTIGLLALSYLIVRLITQRTRTAKSRRRFIRASRMEVSGATVVDIRQDDRGAFLLYIEDDETGIDGRPYIMECPAAAADLAVLKRQDRLIVLYATDDKGAASYQLMRRTGATRGLIPDYPPLNIGSVNPDELAHYPHPNALRLDYKEKIITPSNHDQYARIVLKQYRAQNSKAIKICGIILFICINLLITLFSFVEGKPDSVFKTVCIYIAANAAIVWFISFGINVRARNEKKLTDFISVTEVLFQSNRVARPRRQPVYDDPMAAGSAAAVLSSALANVSVYEWDGERFVLNDYPIMVNYKGSLGDIMYKFLLKNGTCMLYPKK